MARSLKTVGLVEIESIRKRVRRQLALKRIKPDDCDWLTAKLDEIEAFVIRMEERGGDSEL